MESSVSPTAAFASIPMLFAIRFGVTTLLNIFWTVCSFVFSAKFLPVSDFSTKFASIFVCRTCSWGMGSATVTTCLGYLVHIVQWCACAFLNFMSTCENGFKTSPLCKCVCQLVAFGFSQQFTLECFDWCGCNHEFNDPFLQFTLFKFTLEGLSACSGYKVIDRFLTSLPVVHQVEMMHSEVEICLQLRLKQLPCFVRLLLVCIWHPWCIESLQALISYPPEDFKSYFAWICDVLIFTVVWHSLFE